jgi:HD-like signal output (HDOD) protein
MANAFLKPANRTALERNAVMTDARETAAYVLPDSYATNFSDAWNSAFQGAKIMTATARTTDAEANAEYVTDVME